MRIINIGMTQGVEKIAAVKTLSGDPRCDHPIVWTVSHTLDATSEEKAADLRGLDVLLIANTGVRRPVFSENVFRVLGSPILLGILDYPTDMVARRVLDGHCPNVTVISPLEQSVWYVDALSRPRNGRPLAEYLPELVIDAIRRRIHASCPALSVLSPVFPS